MMWCVSTASEKCHEIQIHPTGDHTNRIKRGICENLLSKGECCILFTKYVHLNQTSAERAKLSYLRGFLRAKCYVIMFELTRYGFLSMVSASSLRIHIQHFLILYDHQETGRM